MTILDVLIKNSNLTANAFGKKYKIANIYTVRKKEDFNMNKCIVIARDLGLNRLVFNRFGGIVTVTLLKLDEKIIAFEKL